MSPRSLVAILGPGVLYAAAAVGVSHLVQATRAGADYGLGLLAVVVLTCILKYPAILAAVSENGVIGKDGDLPWRLPDEMKYVKRTTMGHTLLMGRKTYESIGKPLPGRTSIVVTRNRAYDPHPEVIVVESFAAGVEAARERGETVCFVFGGESLYAEALPTADALYLTRVHTAVEGDAFFPAFDESAWKRTLDEPHEADERHAHAFSFQVFERA